MANRKSKAVELVLGLAVTNKQNPAVIPYYPQKLRINQPERAHFHRVAPERHGMSSARMHEMLCALESERRANVHSLLVLKDSEVVVECSHPGYDTLTRQLSHSMSKSITGMAIGMLVDDGKLSVDTQIVDIFPEIPYKDRRFRALCVKHLLSMSSAVEFAEVGSVTESEWTRAYFASAMLSEPGRCFAYNSMNSYILARIVNRISGMSLTDFLSARLFAPLGINNYEWEKSPEGIEKGGWGLYLSPESWAKIGVMMLGLGKYEGKRILSERWVVESITTQSIAPSSAGDFNYGYQLWVSRDNDEFLFNGMLGQNVWICPRNKTVAVLSSGNNEMFQQSPALNILRKYLADELTGTPEHTHNAYARLKYKEKHFFENRHWIRPKRHDEGLMRRLIGVRDRFDTSWCAVLGTYAFKKNNYGILPLFVRAMQNNYQGGIESMTLLRDEERLLFSTREGGVDYTVELGIYDFKTTILNICGEKYIVKAMGEATEDEDRNRIFKVELIFPELPNVRTIKLSLLDGERLLVRMSETPNHRIAAPLLEAMPITNPKMASRVDKIDRLFGDRFIKKKMHEMFAPILIGISTRCTDYRQRLGVEEAHDAAQQTKLATKIGALLDEAQTD